MFGNKIVEETLLSENSPVLFNGQPAGIILADSFALANSAATKVNISYIKDTTGKIHSKYKHETKLNNISLGKPIIGSIHDAHVRKASELYADLPFKTSATKYGDAKETKKVTGTFDIGSQYHYTMETQTTVCLPAEDGIDVYSSTQYVDFTQVSVARTLNIPNNSVNMHFKRIGGGYGAKLTRATQIACASALACHLTNCPVRFVMSLESNMTAIGRRYALISEYDADVDATGKIQKLNNIFSQDFGCNLNEPVSMNTSEFLRNCYNTDSWDTAARSVVTNAPSHSWCRAPGSTEAIAMTENIMEHIARVTGLDPLAVRVANMDKDHKINQLLPDFLKNTGKKVS